MDWTCLICGEWADNRIVVGTPQTYWYYLWYCEEHAGLAYGVCEKVPST